VEIIRAWLLRSNQLYTLLTKILQTP